MLRGVFLQEWAVDRDSGTPGRATVTWQDDGWVDFALAPGLLRHESLETLGFLTPLGLQAVRDACGHDYDTLQFMVDVLARGPTWLPRQGLGTDVATQETLAIRVHDAMGEKMRRMAGLP